MADNLGDKVRHALTKERGLVARGEYHYTASDETDKALDRLIVEHRLVREELAKYRNEISVLHSVLWELRQHMPENLRR